MSVKHIIARILSGANDQIINIQPIGNKAKAYQVKQVRGILVKYQMRRSMNDEI
jgi:hypothetical protein